MGDDRVPQRVTLPHELTFLPDFPAHCSLHAGQVFPFVSLVTLHLVVGVVLERVAATGILARVALPALDSRHWRNIGNVSSVVVRTQTNHDDGDIGV